MEAVMRNPLGRIFLGVVITLLGAIALADEPMVKQISLRPGSGNAPAFRILRVGSESMTIELDLPALSVQEIVLDGQVYQQLAIPGGGFRGVDGQPALPEITRLVALPDGRAASGKVTAASKQVLRDYRLWPQQPDGTDRFIVDEQAYGKSGFDEAANVAVGEPAWLGSLRVAPVTFRPVHYDPVAGTVQVQSRMTVELTFTDDDPSGGAVPERSLIPTSFANLYESTVLNYEKGAAQTGPGTYLVICPNDAAVMTALEPLLNWRRRQGYNVLLTHTGTTGTANTAIKSYIQSVYDTVEPPLEFVALAGDANGTYAVTTWLDTASGFQGEGDHYYTMLAGSDVLPDVHIGRLSFRTVAQLQTIVGKIVGYESDPFLSSDPGWYTRASLTGDPGMSGESCIHVNQWLKNQLLNLNYAHIDTIWASPFASNMVSDLNAGDTVAGYRGYYGASGFTTGHVNSLTNGQKLPFAVYITCDTGSFLQDDESLTEAFLRRAGGGAVASIGMSTIHTLTRENNCIYQGIFDGVLNSGDFRVGPALSRGKLEMYNNYAQSSLAFRVEVWSMWNNLIGDPATEIWTAYPKDFTPLYPASLPVGANAATIVVQGAGGVPLADAQVALYKDGEIRVTGRTSNLGEVTLPLSAHTAGTLSVTVTKHNFRPHLGSLTLGTATTFAAYEAHVLDDDLSGASHGNGDGAVNPGETCELAVQVTNLGSSGVLGVVGNLSCRDPDVVIVNGSEAFGDIGPGVSVWSAESFVFSVAPTAADGLTLPLELVLTDGSEFWTSLIELTVNAAACQAEGLTWGGGGATLDPGETGSLSIQLRNSGSLDIAGASATLLVDNPWLSVTDSVGTYGAIGMGTTGENTGDPFAVSIAGDAYPGQLVALSVALEFQSGAIDTAVLLTTIGSASADDPVGPDHYGYCAFDDTDVSYGDVPSYAWVEIDPGQGGQGTLVSLSDTGPELDDTEAVSLPFPFSYYGQNYSVISVCSNGWIAMGHTYLKHWYNKTIPSAGSPDAMIAAFWDDLYIPGGAGVYTWYDSANHRFIVEWSGLKNVGTSATETFQVLLHDPAFYPTDTGDGKIVCQYHTITNNNPEGYATVGIQNQDRSDGLLYTYYRVYAAGAATLAAGRAVAFIPVSPVAPGYLEGDIANLSGGGVPVAGAAVRIIERGRTLLSQENGHYFGSCAPGLYTVVCEHWSFAPDTTYAVSIVEGLTTQLDFDLIDIHGPLIVNTTSYPSTDDTAGPYVIEMNITDYSGLAAKHFFYTSSATGEPFELSLAEIDPGTGLFRAEIPGQPLGTRIQYWVTAVDNAGHEACDPQNAPWSLYAFTVADVVEFMTDDFESASDWTVGDAGDDASSGIWERVDPNGIFEGATEVQPEDDATPDPGIMCYITGNDPPGSPQGVDDVDGGKTTLLSPWFDLSDQSAATVSYRRWYTNDTGYGPGQDYWIVEATDDGSQWVPLENTNVSERSWQQQSFVLSDYIDMSATVRLRFIASDEGTGSLVEAGVDEFFLAGVPIISDESPPTVAVHAPDGGEVFTGGATTINWNAGDDIGVVWTRILLSTDGGKTWPDTLTEGTWNGAWEWTPPAVNEPSCRIKIICIDATLKEGSDTSDADFAISDLTSVATETPLRLRLAANRPNPFNPRTNISFELPRAQRIRLSVFDLEGRFVRTLAVGPHAAGSHTVSWDGTDQGGAQVASGLYFYRLETPRQTLTGKMLLVK
jgi:hypothetical protein